MTARKIIGANIKSLRIKRKWSQEKLAIRSKVSHNFMSQLERGEVNVSIDLLERVAKNLEVDIHILLLKKE